MATAIDGQMEIDESQPKFAIGKLTVQSQEMIEVWTKHILIYESWSRFWMPQLDIYKKCNRFMRRDIFDRGQRIKYTYIQDKIPIEPQEMRPVINSLTDLITDMVKSGSITMEDPNPPPSVARSETVNVVLKWWSKQLGLGEKQQRALREGLLGGYIHWLWFDKHVGLGGPPGGLLATLPAGDSTLCSPWFEEADGGDIEELIRLAHKSKAELYEIYPDRKKEAEKHFALLKRDPGYHSQILNLEQDKNANDRRDILYDLMAASSFESMNGHYLVSEHVYPVKKEVEIWVNEDTEDVQQMPDNWDEEQRKAWLDQHPEYTFRMTDEIRTLWTTTIDASGFVWENGPHWYQEDGELPGVPFIPDMVDKLPMGAGEDMLPYVLQIAAAETEGMSQVRKGTGTMNWIQEGSLRHPSRIGRELNKDNGVGILKKGHTPNDSVKTEQRKPNDTFYRVSDRARDQLKSVHRVNDALLGATQPRQSNKAKLTELNQGAKPQGQYVKNYNQFVLNTSQKLCNMFQYCLNEHMIIQIDDEYGMKKEGAEINTPGFDYSGQASVIANDIISPKWRIVSIPGDDSATSRQEQITQFADLIKAVGNTLFQLSPRFLAGFLSSWPNRYAQEAAKFMAESAGQTEQAEQQVAQTEQDTELKMQASRERIEMEKIHQPRWNLKLGPEDIEAAPEGFKIMYGLLMDHERQAKDAQITAGAAAGAPPPPAQNAEPVAPALA